MNDDAIMLDGSPSGGIDVSHDMKLDGSILSTKLWQYFGGKPPYRVFIWRMAETAHKE